MAGSQLIKATLVEGNVLTFQFLFKLGDFFLKSFHLELGLNRVTVLCDHLVVFLEVGFSIKFAIIERSYGVPRASLRARDLGEGMLAGQTNLCHLFSRGV